MPINPVQNPKKVPYKLSHPRLPTMEFIPHLEFKLVSFHFFLILTFFASFFLIINMGYIPLNCISGQLILPQR